MAPVKKYNKDLRMLDIALLIFFPVLAVVLSFIFNTPYLISTFLFFGIPGLYLSFRTQKAVLRSLIFAFIGSISGTLVVDHLAALDNSWYTRSMFSYRIFNTVSFDDLIWAFLIFYLVIIFYEHFFDKSKHKIIGSHMKYFAVLTISSCTIFLLLLFTNPALLKIKYFYFFGGIAVLLIPTLAFLIEFPKFISKFLKTAPYFFYLGLLDELTALQLDQWWFPGKNFIGWVTILNFRLPYEEVFFFLMISAINILCFFEFFDDDRLWRKK
jgi:hypothetical protein